MVDYIFRSWRCGVLVAAAILVCVLAPSIAGAEVQLVIGTVGVREPNQAVVEVTVTGQSVGGTQNDILFDRSIVDLPSVTRCRIAPAISAAHPDCDEEMPLLPCKTMVRDLVDCGATPSAPGCSGQSAQTGRFRAVVAAIAAPNNNTIRSGSVVYTCVFDVVDRSRLPAVLSNANIVISDPYGRRLEASGRNGAILDVAVEPDPTPTVSPTATATQTPSATPTRTPSATPSPSPTPPRPVCAGDCNGDGRVAVNEIVRAIAIALGSVSWEECPAADRNGDGQVTVDELVRAVAMALNGCSESGES